jgi:hypothetical protein
MSENKKYRTFGEFKIALKEIKENPNNHNYSESDVEEILELEKSFDEISKPSAEALAISARIQERFKILKEGMNKFHITISYNLKNLVPRGWYVSPTVLRELKLGEVHDFTKNDNIENFESYIFYQINLKVAEILNDLISIYPERAEIFSEMKYLYKNKCYYSFINLCYSQVDGICNNKWGQGFFNIDKRNNFILTLPSKFDFDPFSVGDIIGKQLNEPRNEFTTKSSTFDSVSKLSSFNRHLVMHGHSVSYGTKENAIRALLLLEFIKWLEREDIKN